MAHRHVSRQPVTSSHIYFPCILCHASHTMTNIVNAKKTLLNKWIQHGDSDRTCRSGPLSYVCAIEMAVPRRLIHSSHATCGRLPNNAFNCPQYTRVHRLYTIVNGRAAFKYAVATIHRIHVKQIHIPWTPIEVIGVFDNLGWRNRKR
jgi:hypothetical protein